MIFKEAESIIQTELFGIYPESEIVAMVSILFDHLFGVSLFQLHLNANTLISEKLETQIYNIIHQLKQNKPLQYILGETEFYGLRFLVDSSVLIPRPETEELVQWIIADSRTKLKPEILDIGTGSGCIAISLAKNITEATVTAVDVSEAALITAQKNAKMNATSVRFMLQDILHPDLEKFPMLDVIVSNPPYVTELQKLEMLPNVLEYEPFLALFVPNNNPFVFYEAIALFAKEKLKENGFLYFEFNEIYPEETVRCIEKYGFVTELKRDINHKYRMIKAWHHG